jgi:hypothetical protein
MDRPILELPVLVVIAKIIVMDGKMAVGVAITLTAVSFLMVMETEGK